MDLKKRKRRQVSCWVFFFPCFSFHAKKDLTLVKSYNVTVQCFLKTFRRYLLKRLWRRPFFDFQNGLSHEHLPVSFPSTFWWLLPKIEQKRIYLNDNIVLCKKSRVVKDLSNSSSFLLFSVPKHFFILSTRKFHEFLKVFLTK